MILKVGSACAILIAILVWENSSRQKQDSTVSSRLTRPLRLQVEEPAAYKEFLIGLRVHHYRAQPRGDGRFQDVYYDTAEWALFDHGYSYRFRRRVRPDDTIYSIRLEQEPRFVLDEATKIDVVSPVPKQLGETIASGQWSKAVRNDERLAASAELQNVLRELQIDAEKLKPRLIGQLYRQRFDVSDKGKDWFELDHEVWRFNLFAAPANSPTIRYEDIVLDTRLSKENPELLRRVRTMHQFANMISGIRISRRVPHERATIALGEYPSSVGTDSPLN